MDWSDAPIMPTPGAVGLIIQTIAEQYGIEALGVDIGGATTDVFSVFRPAGKEAVFNRLYHSKKRSNKSNRFKVGDSVRITTLKHRFQKSFVEQWSYEVFIINKINATYPVTYTLKDLENEDIIGPFYEQELQKIILPNNFRIEKVLQKRGDSLKVRWFGYPKKFDSWIDKSDLELKPPSKR